MVDTRSEQVGGKAVVCLEREEFVLELAGHRTQPEFSE